ncbi:hypothetical protein FO519_008142 [Halicephalobus sp. NKZ332]|nr:hypothetical protein FO519_008142 [Halicephalobus sp. NKZ332]
MYRGGSRERKRPAVDPRKRPGNFPEGAPFVKGRETPGFAFSPQIEFKAESKPETLSPILVTPRQKPKPEWKVDMKPQLSQFSVVLGELSESVQELKYDNIRKLLSRISSVYVHRLTGTDAVNLVKKLGEIIGTGYSTFSVTERDVFTQEFLQLTRTVFLRCPLESEIAVKFCDLMKKNSFGDRNLGYFLSILEILLKNKIISTEICLDLLAGAKRKLLCDADDSRIFTAKFLIEFLKNDKDEKSKEELQNYLMNYCSDRCPKVRKIIIEGIEEFFEDERKAPLEYYDLFTDLTKNSDVAVRLSALRILKMYAQFFPEEIVSKNRNFPLRLTDDAFTLVCHAMNDLVVDVRSQAAKLLGTFENVSESFLFQTLDKKLMKNMKRLADGRVSSSTSEWSSGKKLGEDCPVEAQEEEAQSMIPTGACGAFVSALEDEFKAVRQPAVYSLGKLAANRPIFANACIDHLADMFNDEIAAVRIDAIRALTPLVTYGTLELDQLKTLLTGFDDASSESRIALMELIGKSNFVQQDCLSFLLQRLLDTMYRFPEDKVHIFECISSIGLRHAHLTVDIVSDIYKAHPYLQRKEEKIDDPFYLTKLILALNSASRSPAVRALLPEYAQKHYRFLRLAMPNLVFPIPEFDSDSRKCTVFSQNQKEQREDIDAIVGREYNRLMEIQKKTDFGQKEKDFQQLLNDMKFFLSVEPQFANASNYLYGLTDLMMLMDRIINEVMNGNLSPFLEIEEAMEKISFIEYRYLGIEEHVQIFLLECSLVLSIIYCRNRVVKDQNFNNFVQKVFTEDLARVNKSSIENSFLKLEDEKMNLQKIGLKTVKIVEPAETKNVNLIIGLPTGVFVNCILNHFTEDDIRRFKVKIKYVDDSCAYFLPPRSDFEQISETQWRIKTNVTIIAKEANSQGFFISLPNAENVLKSASCQVQTQPTQVKTIS